MSFLRIFIGIFFIVSGGEKLIHPYQNFLYVVQAYQLFPAWGEGIVARVIPWVELLLGAFAALGLWIPLTLRGIQWLFFGFIIILGQGLIRGLPLSDCGCFGEMLHLSPQLTIVMDSLFWLVVCLLRRHVSKTEAISLDRYFSSAAEGS